MKNYKDYRLQEFKIERYRDFLCNWMRTKKEFMNINSSNIDPIIRMERKGLVEIIEDTAKFSDLFHLEFKNQLNTTGTVNYFDFSLKIAEKYLDYKRRKF